MRSILLFLTFFTIHYLSGQTVIRDDKAQTYLDQTINDGECKGLSAGYSVLHQARWTSGAGYANEAVEEKFSAETVSRIASITKPITAIAVMQLVEKGRLSLDDHVGKYLSGFTQGKKAKITIRHLLQHSSGIGQYANKKEQNNQKAYATLQEAVNIFKDRKLAFDPGTQFAYTSYGYVVLGRIIEVASGQNYGEYVQQSIFDPAGMSSTSLEPGNERVAKKAALYHQKKKGKIKQIELTNISDRIPGGGVQSTANDLLKFGDAVLNHELITKESLDLMIKNYGLKTSGNGYGLGWYLYGVNSKYGNIFGHNGAQLGCSSILLLLPEQKTSVVVLSNTSGAMQGVFHLALSLFDQAGAYTVEK